MYGVCDWYISVLKLLIILFNMPKRGEMKKKNIQVFKYLLQYLLSLAQLASDR